MRNLHKWALGRSVLRRALCSGCGVILGLWAVGQTDNPSRRAVTPHSEAARLHPAGPCTPTSEASCTDRAACMQQALDAWGDEHTGVAWGTYTARVGRAHGQFPFEVERLEFGLNIRKSFAADLPVGALVVSVNGAAADTLGRGWPDGAWNDLAPAALGLKPGTWVSVRWIRMDGGDTVSTPVQVRRPARKAPLPSAPTRADLEDGVVCITPGAFSTAPGALPDWPAGAGVVLDLRGHRGGGVQEAVAWARKLTGYTGPLPQAVVLKGSPEARALQPRKLAPGGGAGWEQVWRQARELPDGAVDTVRFQSDGPEAAAFEGRCAVLVDAQTSSAAAALADWLQRRGDAVVFGTPWAPSAGGTWGNAVSALGGDIRVATAGWMWDTLAWDPCGGPGMPDLRLEPGADVRSAGVAWAAGRAWEPDSATCAAWMARYAPERWALWAAIERELKPAGAWRTAAWAAVGRHATEVAWADLAGAQAERKNDAGAREAAEQAAAKKNAAKLQRDEALRAACPAEDLARLNALLNPAKPAVLHFGIHDRMNCGVCKPGEQ